MPLTHLLVDFAGVIGQHQRDTDLSDMAGALGIDIVDFESAYWHHRAEYDRGLEDQAYWELVATRPLPGDLVARVVDLDRASWLRLDTKTIEILARHQQGGATVTLLSNAPHFLADAVRRLQELSFFDAMTFSCELGIAKPDPESFTRALAAAGAHAAGTVFIDDRAENIGAAEALDIRSVHFVGAGELDASLEQLSER